MSKSKKSRIFWLLCIVIAACDDDPSGTSVLSSLTIAPDSIDVPVGQDAQLTATARDQNGNVLSGQAISWSSSDQGRATVSATGVVHGVNPGRAVISATAGNVSNNAVVNVTGAAGEDFELVDARFTQAVQANDATIPMVLGGNAAVLNVLISSTVAVTTDPQLPVVLRLFNANGVQIRADTVRSGRVNQTPTYATPAAQFLVPANVLAAGMMWQVEIDPGQTQPDANRSNNIFPRTGRRLLATTSVPDLRVRFVPITLSAHNNTTVTVTQAQMPEYLRTLRSVHPVGAVTTTIGTSITTAANFGTAPSGGQAPFWQQVLGELDLARVVDASDPQAYWYGLVRPPAGFTFTAFGGFGYIPSSGQATGAGTRTALAVGVGWFSNPIQSRELVAHELGHNFGRQHAPCGNAGNPDPTFPQSNGTIGHIGHDVYSWSIGAAPSAVPIDPGTGDVMGYCLPSWVSEYTYRAVLTFRGFGTVALAQSVAPTRRTDVLIVRGHIAHGRTIRIEPVLTLPGRPTRPERTGPYRLEGRSASGDLLFAHNFEPAVVDHAPELRPFLFALELSAAERDALATVDVRGPAAAARLERPVNAALRPAPARTTAARRTGAHVRVQCADAATRGIALLDAAGSLLATAPAAEVQAGLSPGARVVVACSDGIQTTHSVLITP